MHESLDLLRENLSAASKIFLWRPKSNLQASQSLKIPPEKSISILLFVLSYICKIFKKKWVYLYR